MRTGTDHPAPWPVITKNVRAFKIQPHLADYEATRKTFSWDQARRELSGLPGGRGLNIADEAVDRHATGSKA